MKLILSKNTKEGRADYRKDICCLCGKECMPEYRFYYYSKEEELNHPNPLIDGELGCCDKCYPTLLKMFKN